ncbi:MAG: chemotaxis protein CheW [Verrucomicrobia bacterium]|nr:chemotaxis protein CheW [Verrucomicrobiota bacterium]
MSTSTSPAIQPAAKPGRFLTFTLGNESYGLPVLNVREIIRICPITPVPTMPTHIKGVINLRGSVIAVVDLRAKFQLSTGDYGDRACIIVVQLSPPSGNKILMGAIVDAVEEVIQISQETIEPPPDFGGAPDTQYILGVATAQGGVKTLLNIERIFLQEAALQPSLEAGSMVQDVMRVTLEKTFLEQRSVTQTTSLKLDSPAQHS